MTVTELAVARSVASTHEPQSSIDRSLISAFEHDIALCGPILKVQRGVVYLAHQSVKEFMLNPDLRESLGDFSVRPESELRASDHLFDRSLLRSVKRWRMDITAGG